MKLYKKIVKGIVLGGLLLFLGLVLFVMIQTMIDMRLVGMRIEEIIFSLLFLVCCSGTIVYHIKYFSVYESGKRNVQVEVKEVLLTLCNFSFLGFGLLGSIVVLIDAGYWMILPLLLFVYLIVETYCIRKYLNRAVENEMFSDIEDIGKNDSN